MDKKFENAEWYRLHQQWLKNDLDGVQADLTEVNLSGADLTGADLRWGNLIGANLTKTDLTGANLRWVNLSGADLSGVDLTGADLRGSNLSGSNLRKANLHRTNLTGVAGLLNPAKWIAENFETDDSGVIVYKRIGNAQYDMPNSWVIEPSSFITEVCNPLPTVDCGCGVNFATHKWCENNYVFADLWECRINWIDLAGLVVPYNTDGKARCGRLELLRVVGFGGF